MTGVLDFDKNQRLSIIRFNVPTREQGGSTTKQLTVWMLSKNPNVVKGI